MCSAIGRLSLAGPSLFRPDASWLPVAGRSYKPPDPIPRRDSDFRRHTRRSSFGYPTAQSLTTALAEIAGSTKLPATQPNRPSCPAVSDDRISPPRVTPDAAV
ncbi:hypothetical protein GCM10027089_61170 [Nocardia thraciensis]